MSSLTKTEAAPATPVIGRDTLVWIGLIVAGIVSLLIAAAVGSVSISPAETFRVLTGGHALDPGSDFILREVRLPRIATAALVGAALGVAGLQMQTLFRNPLADPYVLGANSGASLGVALVALTGGTAGAATFAGGHHSAWAEAVDVLAAASAVPSPAPISARRYSGAPPIRSIPRTTGRNGCGSTATPICAATASAAASACWAASPPCLSGNAVTSPAA